MTHKQRAKRYFKDLHLTVYGYYGPESEKQLDKVFHHLFEAIKDEVKQDLLVSSPELLTIGRIVDAR